MKGEDLSTYISKFLKTYGGVEDESGVSDLEGLASSGLAPEIRATFLSQPIAPANQNTSYAAVRDGQTINI